LSLEHGKHNEEACDYLFIDKRFYDWVVTTAFYSALHYVHTKIFPFKEGLINYTNFESYYIFKNSKEKNLSKHSLTISLVVNKIPAVRTYYRRLYDMCMSARYKDYKTSYEQAKKAKEDLEKIKSGLKIS